MYWNFLHSSACVCTACRHTIQQAAKTEGCKTVCVSLNGLDIFSSVGISRARFFYRPLNSLVLELLIGLLQRLYWQIRRIKLCECKSHITWAVIYCEVLTNFVSNFLTAFHVVVSQIMTVQSFDHETRHTPSELNDNALIAVSSLDR